MRRVAQFTFRTLYELANAAEITGYREAARSESKESEKSLLEGAHDTGRSPGRHLPYFAVGGSRRGDHQDHSRFAGRKRALLPGDRVVKFAGREIRHADELSQLLQIAHNPAEAEVWREGSNAPLTLKLELDGNPMRIGITWRVDEAEPGTVLLTYVMPDSPAAKAGLAAGDRIYRIGGRNFADEKEFAERVRGQKSGPIELSVERDGRIRHAVIRFAAEELRLRRRSRRVDGHRRPRGRAKAHVLAGRRCRNPLYSPSFAG